MITEIDTIRIHFSDDHKLVMNACLSFVMFGVALHISVDDFRRISKFPKSILVGLASQWLILPILTVYLIHVWNPPPSVALGLLLVASCPGGNLSNFMTQYSKGNAALSVTLSSIVSLSSMVLTPLAFLVYSHFVPSTRPLMETIRLDQWEMVRMLLILLVAPLCLGVLTGILYPKLTARIRKTVQRISLLIYISFIIAAIYPNLNNLVNHVHRVFLLVVLHNMLGMLAGYYWAKWHRLPEADAKAISMETGIQNAGLGLALVFTFFPYLGGMMLVVAFWAIWDMISSLLVGFYWHRKRTV